MIKFQVWTAAVIAALLAVPVTSQAGPTCENTTNIDDQLVKATYAYTEDYRTWFSNYYAFHQGDWDEGWGWAQSDFTYEFPKMANATVLLSEIDHTTTGRWEIDYVSTLPVTSLWDAGSADPGQPVFQVQPNGFADVFIKSRAGNVFYYRYDTTLNNQEIAVVNVTTTAVNPQAAPLAFTGPLAILSRPGASPAVLGMSGGQPDNMIVFRQVSGGGWEASPVGASGPDLRVSTPVVVQPANGSTLLLGVNPNGRVVQYMLSSGYDVTAVEMLPYLTGEWKSSKKPGSLVATVTGDRLEVFVPRDPDGKLLYFWRDMNGGSWQAKNLTDSINLAMTVTPSSRLALVQRSGTNLTLFGLNGEGS